MYAPAYKIPLEQVLRPPELTPVRGEMLRWEFMRNGLLGDRLGLYVLSLGLSALALVLIVRRARRTYPVHLVPRLLLTSPLAGLALIAPTGRRSTLGSTLPFALAAIVEVLRQFSGRRWAPAARIAAFGSLIRVPGIREMRNVTPVELIFTSQFEQAARASVQPGESDLGDYVYW